MKSGIVLHLKNLFNRRYLDPHICFYDLLLVVVLVEVCEENWASLRYVVGKSGDILAVLL